MTAPLAQILTLNEIIDVFEATYREWLNKEGLDDNIVSTSAFYVAAEVMVRREPFPNGELQRELLEYLRAAQSDEMIDTVDSIQAIFVDVTGRMRA